MTADEDEVLFVDYSDIVAAGYRSFTTDHRSSSAGRPE